MNAASHSVRRPAVAGLFYPADAGELSAMVEGLLRAAAKGVTRGEKPPKAIIAPHAGYIYSGPTAAAAYARIAGAAEKISRVVLLGPAHRYPFRGLALPGVDSFETPLGRVPLDKKAAARIERLRQVKTLPEAHAGEHSLEVQLPFLQTVLEEFALVPLVVGDAAVDQVAEVLDRLWGGQETLVVISTDLSHYHDYDTASRRDVATRKAIEALAGEKIGFDDACGAAPLAGLLSAARARGLKPRTLDLRNSGDTAGPRDAVVGYGAWAVG